MMKVYNIRNILKILILFIFIILVLIFILNLCLNIKQDNAILTSSSNKSEYKILVDVESSRLFLFENEELIKTYKCSGGKWSTPSPIGTWTVVSKAKWGEGFGRKLATDLMFLGVNLEYTER